MRFFLLSMLLLARFCAPGQTVTPLYAESGVPLTTYFSPKKYQADPQNWAIVQRDDGVVVIGNGKGILTFDGAAWQLIPVTNANLVRCLEQGPDGMIFVGGYNEIGYVNFHMSVPVYTSLVPELEEGHRLFGHTWNISRLNEEIYFSTDKYLLKWSAGKFTTIDVGIEEGRAFTVALHDRLFVQPLSEPLSEISHNTTRPVPGGEFYRGKRITAIVPFDERRMLVSTLSNGLFLYDGSSSLPFATDLTEYLSSNRLYKAIALRNGNFALATLQHGVAVIDRKGEVVHLLEKGSGINDDVVYNLMEDREGALWAALSVGLSRVELQTPVTLFGEGNGLTGAVNDIVRFGQSLYAATMLGLYQLRPSPTVTTHASFAAVPEIQSSVWALGHVGGSLLLATDDGTMELKGGRVSQLDKESGAVLLVSERHKNTVFIGLADGVSVLQFSGGQWKSLGRISNLEADVGEMNEDAAGNLWLGTFSEGAIRLSFSGEGADKFLHPTITYFGAADGLPVGYIQISTIDGVLMFRSEPGRSLYRLNNENTGFSAVGNIGALPGYDSAAQYPLFGEKAGKLWMLDQKHGRGAFDIVRLTRQRDGYLSQHVPFTRIRDDFDEVLFEDTDGILWMGGLDGILRYDLRRAAFNPVSPHVVFNKILLEHDSVLHDGMGTPVVSESLPYELNSMTFSYGATAFDLLEENEFQYILEGYDENWSAWSRQTAKSYTHLSEGQYTFKVRCRNIYGIVGPESQFTFSIDPPWYRHPLAYIAYAAAIVGLVFTAVRLRSRKLEAANAALQHIIEERTAEITSKNAQLEHQAEELKTQTEQLTELDKIKTAFFTNISHEFRTPLSLILAPLEKEIADGTASAGSGIMLRNARRLQQLINQLLDLSKLEAGEMRVFLCRNDLTEFVSSLTLSFTPLAENRSIQFHIDVPTVPLDVYFDPDKLETVLYNLISNALKFTPENGRVSFSLHVSDDRQQCEIIVEDNGPGISPSDLPKVFNRFYQVESDARRSFEGSGIGLALTQELVELMRGSISVESHPGEGTRFRVFLPLNIGDHSIVPEEISLEAVSGRTITSPHETTVVWSDKNRHIESPATAPSETTILLVEDNADLRIYLSGILQRTYRVITANDGRDAIAHIGEQLPDLILSDMMMPGMDGFTLCEEIRKDPATSHIPFILLTARASVESRLAGLELGADDYMTKPFVVDELLVRIKNLLQQRKLLQERFRQELVVAPQNIAITSADEVFIRKVIEITELHLKDASFSVERLSDEIGISRKHLHRKLVALAGQTPNEFIRTFRLKTAMQMLQQHSGTVKEIAYAVGFNNLSYFAKCFKEEFGMSPTEVVVGEPK